MYYATKPTLSLDEERAFGHRLRRAEHAVYSAIAKAAAALRELHRIGDKLQQQKISVRRITRLPKGEDRTLEEERVLTLLRSIKREPTADKLVSLRLTKYAFERIVRRSKSPRVRRAVSRLHALRAEFFAHNMRLVFTCAKRRKGRGLGYYDLVQEGALGLMRAVETFDVTRGVRLSTYAGTWIIQHMDRAIQNHGSDIRVPCFRHAEISKILSARRSASRTGVELDADGLAAATGLGPGVIEAALRSKARMVSTETPLAENWTVGDTLKSPLALADEERESAERREMVDKLLASVTPREAKVLRLRYGIGLRHDRTCAEAGEMMGVTRGRIQQVEKEALRKCRQHARFGPIDRTPDPLPPREARSRAMDRARKARYKAKRLAATEQVGEAAE